MFDILVKMQYAIRTAGGEHMRPEDHAKFVNLHEGGKLEPPEVPAGIIARLSLEATAELSGKFISYDGPECEPFRT